MGGTTGRGPCRAPISSPPFSRLPRRRSAASWSDMQITAAWREGVYDGVPMSFSEVGRGGCKAGATVRCTSHRSVVSDSACRKLCAESAVCAAYDFCSAAPCSGACNLWPHSGGYFEVNANSSVQCYVKQALIRPRGIRGECCDHGDYRHGDRVNGTSSTCAPPECDSPDIHFMMGPHLLVPPKILSENPTCLGPGIGERRNTGRACWDATIPNSLDECHEPPQAFAVVV